MSHTAAGIRLIRDLVGTILTNLSTVTGRSAAVLAILAGNLLIPTQVTAGLVPGPGEWIVYRMTFCNGPPAGWLCDLSKTYSDPETALQEAYDQYPCYWGEGFYGPITKPCPGPDPFHVPGPQPNPDYWGLDFRYCPPEPYLLFCDPPTQLRAQEYPSHVEPPWSSQDVTDKNLGCSRGDKTADGHRPAAIAGNPCNVASGNKYEIETDSPGTRFRPAVVRHYNSLRHEHDLGLGYGWTASFLKRIEPLAANELKVRRADGRALRFAGSGSNWSGDADADVQVFDDARGYRVVTSRDSEQIYDVSGRIVSETFLDGAAQVYSYDAEGRLERIDGAAGTWLTFTHYPDGRFRSVANDAGEIWTYRYDADGNLRYADNPDGTTREYHYEDALIQYGERRFPHLLTGITDETGTRASTYEYDLYGAVISSRRAGDADRIDIQYPDGDTRYLTNSRGHQSTYQILVQHNTRLVQSITGPGCATCAPETTYRYDAQNNLISVTDREFTTEYGNHDARGNPGYMIERKGTSEERRVDYTYDPRFDGKATTVTGNSVSAGASKVTTYGYDDFGNLTSETVAGFAPDGSPASRSTTFQYDGPYRQLSQVDGPRTEVTDVTKLTYWPDSASEGANRARLRRVTLPNGVNLRDNIQYTAAGQVASEQWPNGLDIEYRYYTGNQRLESITETSATRARETRFTWHATGDIETVTLGAGSASPNVITFQYDAARRLTRVVDGLGNYVDYGLDTEGNRTATEIHDAGEQLRFALSRTFNSYNQISSWSSENESRTYIYNSFGRVANIDDATGSRDRLMFSGDRLLNYWDDFGGLSANIRFEYDNAGRIHRVKDPNWRYTTYAYDDLDNLLSVNSPDTGLTEHTDHDEAGNLLRKVDASGQEFLYTYDVLDRLISIDAVGSVDEDVTYTYDTCANGTLRLCTVTVGAGGSDPKVTAYTYNAFGDVATHQGVAFTYDAAGRVETMTYPSGAVVTYAYDAAGQVNQVDLMQGGQTTTLAGGITRHPYGPIARMQYGNGRTLNQSVDTAYRFTDISIPGVIGFTGAAYDGNGNLTGRTEDLGSPVAAQYGYDKLDRLDTADGAFGLRDYDLDLNGNRIRLDQDGVITDYAYPGPNNRLGSATGWTYGHDANGNLTSKLADDGSGEGWSYVYNAFNRLVRVDALGTTPETLGDYRYNGLGQRISKATSAGLTEFRYGLDGDLLAELDGSGRVVREYVYLDGQPLAMLERAESTPPSALDLIVDDGDPGSGPLQGQWTYETGRKGYDRDWEEGVPGSSSYRWATALPPGTYEVYAWWPSHKRHNRQVAYSIANGEDGWFSAAQDQSKNGSRWNLLGTYTFQVADASVSAITILTEGTLVADAIRFLLIEAAPQTETTVTYLHNDHLGTPRAATDESGALVWKAIYDPYGAATAIDPDGDGTFLEMNLRFPGQYYDEETGLHYNYFRTYDPGTGRYLESDPIGLVGGMNTYRYVGGNPLASADRLGLISLRELLRNPKFQDLVRDPRVRAPVSAVAARGVEYVATTTCNAFVLGTANTLAAGLSLAAGHQFGRVSLVSFATFSVFLSGGPVTAVGGAGAAALGVGAGYLALNEVAAGLGFFAEAGRNFQGQLPPRCHDHCADD